jgi:hypothetical protein
MARSKEDYEKIMSESPFPNSDIDPAIKQTPKWGKRVAKHIYSKALYDEYLTRRRQKIRNNRLYSDGNQDIRQYMPVLDQEIDSTGESYLNISWDIVSPMPVLIDSVLGDMLNQEYNIQFNAIDPKSKSLRDNARDKFIGDYVKYKTALELEKQTGIPLMKIPKMVFKSIDEIDMHMDLTFKQDIEIAFEELTNFEFYNNDWQEISKRVKRDLLENSRAAIRLYFDENNKPRIRYSDIEFIIHSQTDRPDLKDVEYMGELKFITVRELRKLNQHLSEEELFQAAKKAANSNGNPIWSFGESYQNYSTQRTREEETYDEYRIQILDFILYSEDLLNWEWKENKYGNHYFNNKGFNTEIDEDKKFAKSIEREYEGIYVISIDKMASWGRAKNSLRPKKSGKLSSRCYRKFIMYSINYRYNESRSLIDRSKSHLDNIQIASLKMRQFIAQAIPPGVSISIDSLTGVMLDSVKVSDPTELIKLYVQKGILVHSDSTVDGEYMNRPPIIPLPNGIVGQIAPFMEIIRFELEKIREITGISAMDTFKPDKDTAIGIQKLQLINSNNALREIYQTYVKGIYEPTGETLSRMIQIRLVHDPSCRDAYESVIGQMGIVSMEALGDVESIELGIKTEALPGKEEIAKLENDIQIALQEKSITLDDATNIRRTLNTKKGERMLSYIMKKRNEEVSKQRAEQEMLIAEREKMSVVASTEKELQIIKAKTEARLAEIEAEYTWKIRLKETEINGDRAVAHIRGDSEIEKIQVAAELSDQNSPTADIGSKPGTDLVPGVRDPQTQFNPIKSALDV